MKLNLNIIGLCSFILCFIILTGTSYGWEDCGWYKVGYNKTHFTNQGGWCPDGKFITQLDFDGGGYGSKNMGNYPIVGQVKCCRPSSVSTKKQTGEKSRQTYSLTQSDADQIWKEITKIKQVLGIN